MTTSEEKGNVNAGGSMGSVDLIGEGGFVNYGDAWGRGEMEHGFGDGEVFLPIREAEFGFEISGLADDQAHQVDGGIGFEQDLANFLIGVSGFAFGNAAEDIVTWARRMVFGILVFGGVHNFDGAAELREIGLPCQQGERGSPVRAFFYFGAADGAIGGDVEPDVGAVHDEKFLLGRFVFPTHAAGLGEIDDAGFGRAACAAASIAVAFVEDGLLRLRVMITSLQCAEDGSGVARRGRDGRDDSDPDRQEHANSLAGICVAIITRAEWTRWLSGVFVRCGCGARLEISPPARRKKNGGKLWASPRRSNILSY